MLPSVWIVCCLGSRCSQIASDCRALLSAKRKAFWIGNSSTLQALKASNYKLLACFSLNSQLVCSQFTLEIYVLHNDWQQHPTFFTGRTCCLQGQNVKSAKQTIKIQKDPSGVFGSWVHVLAMLNVFMSDPMQTVTAQKCLVASWRSYLLLETLLKTSCSAVVFGCFQLHDFGQRHLREARVHGKGGSMYRAHASLFQEKVQHSGLSRREHQKCQQFIIPWWHRATASLSGLLGAATLYHLFNCTPFWASTPMRSLHRFITACSISIVSFSKPMPLSTLLQTVSSRWKLYIVGISGIKVLYLDFGISEYKHCKNQIKN